MTLTRETGLHRIRKLEKEIVVLRKELNACKEKCREENDKEDALRVQHEILEAVINNIGVGLVVSDTEGNFLSQNKAAEKIHGFQTDDEKLSRLGEYVGEFELEYPDGRKMPFEKWPLPLALSGNFVKDYQVRVIRNGRKPRNISYNTVPVNDINGNLKLIVLTLTDYTDIYEGTAALRKSEEEALERATEIEAILSCIADGVIVYDNSGRITRINAAANKTTRLTEEERKQRMPLQRRYKVRKEDGTVMKEEEMPAYIAAVKGETVANEHIMMDYGNEVIWVRVSAAPLIISGKHTGGILSLSDITGQKKFERSLAYERELFEGIFNNIPVMITMYDPGLNNFRFNKELKKVLGWKEEDAADGRFMEKAYPDPVYRHEISGYMQSLETGWKELKPHSKDGEVVESSWANIMLASGVQIGIGIDIRERKKAEDTLRESEQRLAAIFDYAAIGIAETDSNDVFVRVNDRICKILGYERNELIGKSVAELTAPEDREYSIELNALLHRGEARMIDYEKRYLKKNGTTLWVHVSVSAIRDAEGRYLRSVATFEDISQRKRATDALKESEEKFRLLFENITEGVALHEIVHENEGRLNFRLLEANPAYTELTGIGNESSGKMATDIYSSDEMQNLKTFSRVAATGKPQRVQTFYPGKNRHFIINIISPRKGQFAVVLEDITDHKRTEQEIKMKNEELTRFIYTVSHDLKSPLVTIKSFTSYLKEDIENADAAAQAKDMAYIENAADKMGRLLDELLELSRIGRKEQPKENMSLRTVAQSAIDLIAGRISEKNAEIRFEGPDVMLHGHSQRLTQLYQNLLDNAVKFSGEKQKPVIVIGSKVDRNSNNDIVMYVKDNGAGIDPRYHHKIFGLFEKLDSGNEGTGIGLALVKRIVEVHGGTIWFNSEGEWKGTTFFFTLEGTRLNN